MTKHYDYFVIGAGSGGVRSARIAASHGAKVGIAEGSDLGGTCVNLGCVPKKIMAYGADFHLAFEDAPGYGYSKETPSFDWKILIENKNKEISRLNEIYKKLLDGAGVDIFSGYASFTDEKTLKIGDETITADKILIAVGGKPNRANIPGAEHMLTSDDFFHLPQQPKKPIIIGGGYIAVEFAHILHGLGSDVTLLYRGDLFLRGFDKDIRQKLAEEMRKSGIHLIFNVKPGHIEKTETGFSHISEDGDRIEGDMIIGAIGRSPNIENLDLDKAGVRLDDKGFIAVNNQYQTSQAHIYALGDVTDTAQLTPVAIKEGHILADRLFGNMPEREVNYENIATAVFSHPPLSTVGLTEEQAVKEGYDIQTFTSDFRAMKYILPNRDERTFVKMIIDKKSDKVLGIHMMGIDAPEIMQGFAVALNCGVTKADFDRTMAMHPTSAEEIVTLR